MTQPADKNPAKHFRTQLSPLAILGLIVAAILIAVAAWFTVSTTTTLGRISGRSWSATSSSMKLADIDLITYKTLDGKLKSKDNPVRWHMQLPRAFIVSMSQPAGVPYDTTDGEENANSTFVGINLQFDEKQQEWVPAVLKKHTGKGFISFSVTNTAGYIALGPMVGKCIPQDQFRELQLAVGLGAPASTKCDLRNNRCVIVTDMDRWQIKMSVSADLYKDHENTCRMVKDFLNKHTLVRTQR